MLTAALTGFGTAFALIMAIGAQNAFVLRQGLARAHVFQVCLICALSDALLILAGVAGFGLVTVLWPMLPVILTLGGAAFLVGYGALRFRAAWTGSGALDLDGNTQSLRRAVLTVLALTWLNPHVYLDTLGLIGAVSTSFTGPAKGAFAAGAMLSSLTFFFCLGYGARLLAPMMRAPRAWTVLDTAMGVFMWVLAAGLLIRAAG